MMHQKTKFFGWPYTFSQTLSWSWNHLFGPSTRFRRLSSDIQPTSILNAVKPKIRLGFIGDIMPLNGRHLKIAPPVVEFLSDVDYLIANFEGVLTHKPAFKPFLSQLHSPLVLKELQVVKSPDKIVLCCSNNHAADFGQTAFTASCRTLAKSGFLLAGTREAPTILLDGVVNLAPCTAWSNQKCLDLPNLTVHQRLFQKDAKFNLLFPHWGFEMQAFPQPQQIKMGCELLDTWDAVVGHHAHCPQPVTLVKKVQTQKLLAFSMGNFCTWVRLKKYHSGRVLKVEIGPDSAGRWAVGRADWKNLKLINHSNAQYVSIAV